MQCAAWTGAGSEAAVLHNYLQSSEDGPSATTRSARSKDATPKGIGLNFFRGIGFLLVLADFVGLLRDRLCARRRMCWKQAVVAADDAAQAPEQRKRLHQRQKRRAGLESGASLAAEGCTCSKWWCSSVVPCMPALCAGVVAVLCYLNSLDGEFVHDDMVAVVGNPDVTGEHRPRTGGSPLWMKDFWGRPMADPESHKSYRLLTVLSFK